MNSSCSSTSSAQTLANYSSSEPCENRPPVTVDQPDSYVVKTAISFLTLLQEQNPSNPLFPDSPSTQPINSSIATSAAYLKELPPKISPKASDHNLFSVDSVSQIFTPQLQPEALKLQSQALQSQVSQSHALFQYMTPDEMQHVKLAHSDPTIPRVTECMNQGNWDQFLMFADQYQECPNTFMYLLLAIYEKEEKISAPTSSLSLHVTARAIHNMHIQYGKNLKIFPATEDNLSQCFQIPQEQARFMLERTPIPERILIVVQKAGIDQYSSGLLVGLSGQGKANQKELSTQFAHTDFIKEKGIGQIVAEHRSEFTTISYGMHTTMLTSLSELTLVPTNGIKSDRKEFYRKREAKQCFIALQRPRASDLVHGSSDSLFSYLHDLYHAWKWTITLSYPGLAENGHTLFWKAQNHLDTLSYPNELTQGPGIFYPKFASKPTKEAAFYLFLRKLSAIISDGEIYNLRTDSNGSYSVSIRQLTLIAFYDLSTAFDATPRLLIAESRQQAYKYMTN